ncbi:M23 family metallopeptidase [Sphingomonas koreensis]
MSPRRRSRIAFLIAAAAIIAGPALAQSGYEPPLRANDLAPDERYSAGVHKKKNPAQILGKDIGARRLAANNVWTHLKPGKTDEAINENWVVYGRPFYAMAAGTVVGCWRNAPDNAPGSKHPDFTNDKMPLGGNHLYVLQDDGNYVLYAHAKPGSIPATLCPHNAVQLSSLKRDGGEPSLLLDTKVASGARLTPGMPLGLIGNSGDSSGPHLHVHVVKNGIAQPMPFRRGMTTPLVDEKADINGPWTRLAGKEMPARAVLLWAPHKQGNYSFNGVLAADYQRMVDHLADSELMPGLITCANNGATYDSSWSPMKVKDWASFNAMTPVEAAAKHNHYTLKGYQRTSSYTCGPHSVAVWKK